MVAKWIMLYIYIYIYTLWNTKEPLQENEKNEPT